jgi:hypothetical protein
MIIGMSWPRVIDEQYQGDPFVKLIEFGDMHYVLSEAAFIEAEEENDRRLITSLQRWSL